MSMPAEPPWVSTVMWWQVYPLGFVGAPIRPDAPVEVVTHRLDRIEAWLDHVLALGLNGILLGPVFASASHGYDTTDHFRIDPRLGDERDLIHLIESAHRRGVRVLLDGVFNHVSRTHPAFVAVEAEGPDASEANLFSIDWEGWEPGTPLNVEVFEGHGQLIELDHSSAAAEELVVEVMNHWLDRGVDGWRLDAAYAIPSTFWARVLPRVRERHPGAWFLGEVIHGDYARIVVDSTIDSLTQYELWQGIWHALADRNLFELAHAIGRHSAMLSTFAPQTFVGNHDVTRIASAVGHDLVPHALAVLLAVGGTPSLYAGDEFGYEAVKEHARAGDDAIRPEFPARPPRPDDLPATERSVLELTAGLIALRRRNPWVHRARTDLVEVGNTSILLRTAHGVDQLVIAVNIAESPVSLQAAGACHVVAGAAHVERERIHLPARGWAILE